MVSAARGTLCLEKLETREVPSASQHLFATGTGPGGGPQVNVYNDTQQLVRSFFAYDPNFRGGVTVATGDVNGDGNDDVVTGAGPGGGPAVGVFDGQTGVQIASFYAFNPTSNTAGIKVAVGHVTNDGNPDIVVSGYDPNVGQDAVVIWEVNNVNHTISRVGPEITLGGAGVWNVATSNYTGNGFSDIVLGTPNVQATGTAVAVFSYYLWETGQNPWYISFGISGAVGSVSVAGGNLDFSSHDALGWAYSNGSTSTVSVRSEVNSFLNYDINNPIAGWGGQLSLGFGYLRTPVLGGSVFIGAGPGGGPVLNIRDALNPNWVQANEFVYDPSFRGGIYVS
jgi:hypothetical protein